MKTGKIKTADEQKRMRSMRRKAIAASGMLSVATLFGACPNPTTEYVDRPYWSEDEQPKPAWNKVLKFDNSVDQTTKDKFIAAYDTIDKAYIIDLKYNHYSPVYIIKDDGVAFNTITCKSGMICIGGTVNDVDFDNLFKTALDSYKSATALSILYDMNNNILTLFNDNAKAPAAEFA
jgi:hypothetical protein